MRAVGRWIELDLGGATPREARRAECWQREFLARRADLFEARARGGRVRDVHGELGLEHVFVDGQRAVRLIDRCEFDERLRKVDVCADVALLWADLAAAGRTDLAERFLADYAREANDFDLYPLVDFYASLRANTRGKIEWLRARHSFRDSRSAERHARRAVRYFRLAAAANARPLLPPVVVAVGGQVASGKTTLANALAAELGAPVVNADRTKDHLLGIGPGADLHEAHWERVFEPGFLERTYAELVRRAGAVLASGRPVVLDGCFRSPSERAAARRLATSLGQPFLFVEAKVSEDVQRARLVARSRRDGEADSGWAEIAEALRLEWEAPDELVEAERMAVDTSQPLDTHLASLRLRLPTWPNRLRG